MKSVGVTVIAIGLSTLACDKTKGTPATVVHDFYTAFPGGLLDAGSETTDVAMRRVAPYLSLRLHGLILDAVAYRESWGRHHPPRHGVNGGPWEVDKPPFAEGFGFTSNDEGSETSLFPERSPERTTHGTCPCVSGTRVRPAVLPMSGKTPSSSSWSSTVMSSTMSCLQGSIPASLGCFFRLFSSSDRAFSFVSTKRSGKRFKQVVFEALSVGIRSTWRENV
jgi:hypothetical protein